MGREVVLRMETNANAELALRVKALEVDLASAHQRISALANALVRLEVELADLRGGRGRPLSSEPPL